MRNQLSKLYDHDPHFNWRGRDVTRIENLSDIVFALALGMLVSASSPPATYGELLPHILNIIPVTAGFVFMVLLWNIHFIFFRRYGIADQKIIWLNGILLLLILFVAYPLRFAFDSLFAFILMTFGSLERMQALGIDSYRQAGNIIALFYIGYGLAHLIYQSMYTHALKQADILELTAAERKITLRAIWRFRLEVILAVIIAPLATFTLLGPFAAMLGIINWPGAWLIERRFAIELPPKSPVEAAG